MVEPKNNRLPELLSSEATKAIDLALASFLLPRLAASTRGCVGLSGGMDSVVLVHALNRLRHEGALGFDLSAVHVHHGISPRADDWADFCRRYCERLSVALNVVKVTVPRDSGEGLEGAARRLRHEVFSGVEADWLALAHHRDDQAETVLLNLLRGAGVAGAAGMLAVRPQACGPALVRPLLDVPRAVVAGYAEAHGLRWIEDESNDDRHFRRNFLRHEILPRLEGEFPGASRSLSRAAGHFAESAALLDDLAAIDRAAIAAASGRLALEPFNRFSVARARNLLRFAWTAAGFRAPDTRWIDEALKQLATANALSEIRLATSDGELHVYRGELYIVRLSMTLPTATLPWRGEDRLPWAGGYVRFVETVGQGIRRSALAEADVRVTPRLGGERLQPDVRRPRRSLRNLLQEMSIPPWERRRLPMLRVGEQLAWVGGIGCDTAFVCSPGEAGILPVWDGG